MHRPTQDRRSLLAGLGAALAAPAIARGQDAPSEAPPPALPDLALEEDRSSRLTTPVFLDGKGPFEFVVDTGANRTTLSAELASALGFPRGPTVTVHGVAGLLTAPTARIGSVRVGALETPGVSAPLFPRSALGAEGLLGIDVFRDRRVELDFEQNLLRLDPPRRSSAASGRLRSDLRAEVAVPARQRSGQLIIFDAEAHGRGIVCFIDTGTALSIGNDAMFDLVARRNLAPRFQPTPVTVRSATGQTVQGRAGDVGELRIGTLEFADFAMIFAPLHTFRQWGLGERPAMLFGTDVLRMFPSVTLDFDDPRVTFRTTTNRRRRPGFLSDEAGPLPSIGRP